MKISLIVPLLSHEPLVGQALSHLARSLSTLGEQNLGDWEVILSDANDDSLNRAAADPYVQQLGWTWVGIQPAVHSLGQTVSRALDQTKGEFLCIVPIDCYLSPTSLAALWDALVANRLDCGGFCKLYSPSTRLLSFYARLQNLLGVAGRRHLGWANGIFFHRSYLDRCAIPEDGTMEDLRFSDFLRQKPGWGYVTEPILASSRRYFPDRILRRIFVDLLAVVLYRLHLTQKDHRSFASKKLLT
jgi:hypothetical protein